MESHPKPSVYSEALVHPQDSNGSALNLVFLDQYTEADVSSESEWLSNFVEECLSSAGSGNCLPPSKDPQNLTTTITNPNSFKPNNHHQNPQKQHSIPGKPRSQRGRKPSLTKTHKTPLFIWPDYNSQSAFTDPPLLEQGHWLADSELLSMPRKEEEEQKKVEKEESEEGEDLLKQQQQQSRRCSHCQSQKTPQWRAGPMGPKTLCNACGMRYFKSGRLLPEYRPAKSPTFLSYKHSNSHKKVLQMRMALISSSTPLLQ